MMTAHLPAQPASNRCRQSRYGNCKLHSRTHHFWNRAGHRPAALPSSHRNSARTSPHCRHRHPALCTGRGRSNRVDTACQRSPGRRSRLRSGRSPKRKRHQGAHIAHGTASLRSTKHLPRCPRNGKRLRRKRRGIRNRPSSSTDLRPTHYLRSKSRRSLTGKNCSLGHSSQPCTGRDLPGKHRARSSRWGNLPRTLPGNLLRHETKTSTSTLL
jgi:hypothetical protein